MSFKHTKILSTLGPATSSLEKICALIEAGANVFRINFSHGSHEEHAQRIQWVREAGEKLGKPVGVLMDLQGPKFRVGVFENGPVKLEVGAKFTLDTDPTPGNVNRVCFPHPEAIGSLSVGSEVFLDDGNLRLVVTEAADDRVVTEVVVGGELSERKGVNMPGNLGKVNPLTEKDLIDLEFGLSQNVDWVALSFVQTPADIVHAKELIAGRATLVAKIEKPSAVEQFEEIVKVTDAIMIARGDLGVEMPPHEVPGLQKMMIKVSRQYGRPVIVATQMLESMRDKPRPTRAEVSDVANAVYEGADAVMLSAETASGDFPIEAVTMMSDIIRQVEADPLYHQILDTTEPVSEPTVESAIGLALQSTTHLLDISAIINYTSSGFSTLQASRERPAAPILSLSHSHETARRLSLVWGVYPLYSDKFELQSEMVDFALAKAVEAGFSKPGDKTVITAGVPFGVPGTTNMLRIETVK
ncbi:MAG: pyruvate kinase [Pseudomonadales bacterium]|jgi:pyruvate kinase